MQQSPFLNQIEKADIYLKKAKAIAAQSKSSDTKGIVTMALANAYWNRKRLWFKLFALFLAIKGLAISPPWRSTNGRIALQLTFAALTKSAKNIPTVIINGIKKIEIRI